MSDLKTMKGIDCTHSDHRNEPVCRKSRGTGERAQLSATRRPIDGKTRRSDGRRPGLSEHARQRETWKLRDGWLGRSWWQVGLPKVMLGDNERA